MTLKELREAKGLSQYDVAKALDVDQGAVSHWERGKNTPLRKYRVKLAALYGVTVEQLMDGGEGGSLGA